MEFRDYFLEQAEAHPAMEAQDAVKLCYQAAFGAEHLLRDREAAYQYLKKEYDAMEADSSPLYEQIHPGMCRVSLAAWKRERLPLEWLFRMFAETAAHPQALHHSERYRSSEHPAYRLVCSRFIRLFPLLQATAGMSQEKRIVALDGRCASGKTTLAEQLAGVTGAGVVHMDDFFLPPSLRSPERLAEPGGNVHYERFMEEVLIHLKSPKAFRYRCFDCSRMEPGAEREVREGTLRIVEGAYSCHPVFGEYMGLRVFCDVKPQEQLRRIERRDGANMLKNFRERWIPMEEQYIRHFQIMERAGLVL